MVAERFPSARIAFLLCVSRTRLSPYIKRYLPRKQDGKDGRTMSGEEILSFCLRRCMTRPVSTAPLLVWRRTSLVIAVGPGPDLPLHAGPSPVQPNREKRSLNPTHVPACQEIIYLQTQTSWTKMDNHVLSSITWSMVPMVHGSDGPRFRLEKGCKRNGVQRLHK